MLRDENPDIETINTRLSKLRTYCSYCKMNGQFDEYRDAMSEILEIQKQIEDMRNGEMKSKVKDRNIEINQGQEYTTEEKDKILEKFGGKVHFISSGGGYFRIDKLDDSIKGKVSSVDSKTKDSQIWSKNGIVVNEEKDSEGTYYTVINTKTGEHVGDYDNESLAIAAAKNETSSRDATNYNGERTFQTYEAWKRACKQIDPNVKFDGDKDICQAGKVGEWDGDKGIIYNTKDRKTKDAMIKYKGFSIVEDMNGLFMVLKDVGKYYTIEQSLEAAKDWIDDYLKQTGQSNDSKKLIKDAAAVALDQIRKLKRSMVRTKDSVRDTDYSQYSDEALQQLLDTMPPGTPKYVIDEIKKEIERRDKKTKDEDEGLYYYKQWAVYGKNGKWTATRKFLGKTGSPGRGEVKITAKSFEEAKSKIDDYIRQIGHDKKTKDDSPVYRSGKYEVYEDGNEPKDSRFLVFVEGNHRAIAAVGSLNAAKEAIKRDKDIYGANKYNPYNTTKDKKMKDAAAVALKSLGEVRKQMKDRKTKDDALISHYKGYMITTNGNKFQATNTVRQIDAFSKEELYRKVDDIEEKLAKMREINRRNADSKTKDINPPSESERIKNDFEAGRKDHNAGYYDKWYRWNRKDNGRAYDDGFNSVAGKPVQIIEAMHDSKTKDAELIKKLNGFTIYRDGDEYIVIRDKDNKQVFKSDRSMRTAPLADAYDFIYSQTKDSISVGKHNADPDDKFNAEELAMGIKIEMEHTENEDIAKAIAKDHLNEVPDYYSRLTKMEEEAIEAEKVTKDEGNSLVGKRIIVNAGRFTNAPATVIEIGGQVTHGVNGVYAKMDTGEKVWVARSDFEFKDSKTKDASQAYIDGYTAARGAYHKGTNPIKNDPAKAAEWDRGWEDGKADKDELSAKGSGQEYIKYGSHFKDKKMKDGNGEQALDKCRHSLFPVANELATIASSSIYEDRIRKAAKRAERLVDEARHVLFDAV